MDCRNCGFTFRPVTDAGNTLSEFTRQFLKASLRGTHGTQNRKSLLYFFLQQNNNQSVSRLCVGSLKTRPRRPGSTLTSWRAFPCRIPRRCAKRIKIERTDAVHKRKPRNHRWLRGLPFTSFPFFTSLPCLVQTCCVLLGYYILTFAYIQKGSF